MPSANDTTFELMGIIERLQRGERTIARAQFEATWARLDSSDLFHRCVLAHYMADAQDDLREELRWDQLALDAASAAVPQEFDGRFPGMTLASFFPSLHLNLAADYEKLGDLALARKHAVMAAEAVPALDDSGLGSMTSAAIERLLGRLADAPHGHESD